MKQVVIKLPPNIHTRLKFRAKKRHRTAGQQLIAIALGDDEPLTSDDEPNKSPTSKPAEEAA
ncbi:hypothetical protein [Prosthecobacter debontii]|uniref:hypothetical protein n=1 Tax=Prosthecobacter debontii TaxID=48467 RepID=UPI000999ADC4|nr:hypothetical protein [Prosthecobacter debontii]